jgi:hypothetical protein
MPAPKRASVPRRPILLALTSDQHPGSTVGLCPPEGARLDDGGYYHPSKAQRWLWEKWEAFWTHVGRRRDETGAQFIAGFNGDAAEGNHHGTTQIVSGNAEVQAFIMGRVFGVPLALKPEAVFVVRGTEAHVGPSGASEEALARSWAREGHTVIKDKDADTWSHWHFRARLNGMLLDCQHHGRTGGRPWTELSAVENAAAEIALEHYRAGEPIPDLIIRSHRHKFNDTGPLSRPRLIQTCAWQLKTAFGHKVAANKIADVGGHLVLIQPDGSYEVETLRYRPALPAPWSP